MESADMSTSMIRWWFRAILREPGVVAGILVDRAGEKSLISRLFLE
jgi:hypothetical protein